MPSVPVGTDEKSSAAVTCSSELSNAIPIVRHLEIVVDESERRQLQRLAADIQAVEPNLALTDPFGRLVSSGLGSGPNVVIEDHGAIQLTGPESDLIYGHRARMLAGEGDVVILDGQPNDAFVDYFRDILRLGNVEFISPGPSSVPRHITLRCVDDPSVISTLARLARDHGRLNIVPYIGSGDAWRLASVVAEASGVEVRVAASPPNLTQRVNDKLWFGRLLTELLGLKAAPPFFAAYGPAGLIACIRRLAQDHNGVAVKLPSSASGSGNVVLNAEEVQSTPSNDLIAHLNEALHLGGEGVNYPVMVCAWKKRVLATPSVQTWIPNIGHGDPIIEGVFDQVVTGAGGTFVGAAPANLDSAWVQILGHQAMAIALVLQELGYFGRCSFDAVLVGEDEANAEIDWIECNGRWGGVSLPMTLANRLTGDWMTRPFVIIEGSTLLPSGPRRFADVLQDVSDKLFRPGNVATGIVFLSPARVERGDGLDAMVMDYRVQTAQKRAQKIVAHLYGDQA